MLITALRRAAVTVRRAGLRGLGLVLVTAALDFVPLPGQSAAVLYLPLLFTQFVLMLALLRVLVAHRAEPYHPVVMTDDGRAVAPLRVVPPPDSGDRSPLVALRRITKLGFPALRLAAVYLLLTATTLLLLYPLFPESVREAESSDDLALYSVPVTLAACLLTAFTSLAPARVAIDGDPRILIAIAHSVRIARQDYGTVFALSVLLTLPPALGNVALALDWSVAVIVAAVVASIPITLIVVAAQAEVFLAGPRLDVPPDFGRSKPDAP